MKEIFRLSLLLVALVSLPTETFAHGNDSSIIISYAIEVGSRPDNLITPGDLYNGGSKIIFATGTHARIKLVTLMRVENLFFASDPPGAIQITRVKETYKKNIREKISMKEWLVMNKKYEGALLDTSSGQLTEILGYSCRKATLKLTSGETIEICYSKQLPPIPPFIDPAFASVPGLVLRYSYSTDKGTVSFTAQNIQIGNIDPSVFNLPK